MSGLQSINRKGQAILYGPPGTGKTFLAERLARHLVSGGDGFVDLVQFHPAYAYEDFMQGIRPQVRQDGTGALEYSVVQGGSSSSAGRRGSETAPAFSSSTRSTAQTLRILGS